MLSLLLYRDSIGDSATGSASTRPLTKTKYLCQSERYKETHY